MRLLLIAVLSTATLLAPAAPWLLAAMDLDAAPAACCEPGECCCAAADEGSCCDGDETEALDALRPVCDCGHGDGDLGPAASAPVLADDASSVVAPALRPDAPRTPAGPVPAGRTPTPDVPPPRRA